MSASSTLSLLISTGRKSALDVVNDVAYYGNLHPFASQTDAKAWAQSVSYADLAPMVTPYGYDVAYALARYAKGEAVTNGAESMAKLVARTFPCIGKVSVRHDSRKSAPTPSKGVDVATFSACEHSGVWAAFGVSPKAVKVKSHVSDPETETQVQHDDMTDIPVSAPIPEGMAPNIRGDLRFTLDGVAQYADQQVARALSEHVVENRETARADWYARQQRVIRKARALRSENASLTAKARALRSENASLKAQVASLKAQLETQSKARPASKASMASKVSK